jgi:DNA-binding transcriptional LysR family regulator
VGLEFYEATSAEILEGLATRRFDAGLLRYPVLELDEGIELTPLDQDEFVLAVSDNSPWRSATPSLCPRQRTSLCDVSAGHGTQPRRAGQATLPAIGLHPRIAQEAMQVQTIMSLVASGLGVGLVAGVSHLVQPRGVKCLPLLDNPPGFHVGIALVHSLTGQPGRGKLIEHALQHAKLPAAP